MKIFFYVAVLLWIFFCGAVLIFNVPTLPDILAVIVVLAIANLVLGRHFWLPLFKRRTK